jgi:large subunit ribosomal protein L25
LETLSITLSPREVKGKKVSRLRQEGVVPVHFYGPGVDSASLQVDLKELRSLLISAGRNLPITVKVAGEAGENICFVRETQVHPVTEELLHVDFYRVDVSQTVRAEVPILLEGEPPAVRNLGGILLQPFDTLEVEALPLDMPESFRVDVTILEDFSASIRIGDIEVAEGVNILRDPVEMIARVVAPRIEEEEVPETEGDLELGEGEEGADGEEGAGEAASDE